MRKYDILILADYYAGHVYPLFGVANNLKEAGYDVCFMGIPDTSIFIEKHGFRCFPIFKNKFPIGHIEKIKNKTLGIGSIEMDSPSKSIFDELDNVISVVQPKIILLSSFFALEALLIHYKYGVKQIIFRSFFPSLSSKSVGSIEQLSVNLATETLLNLSGPALDIFMEFFDGLGHELKSFEQLLMPIKKLPHLVLCAKELNILNSGVISGNAIYLGSCIRPAKKLNKDFLNEILSKSKNRKIIYVSMGSHSNEYRKKAEDFFNTILEATKSKYLKSFYFVLSLGSETQNWNLIEHAENTHILPWVPQLSILTIASGAIIHGGLGSIKECIHFAVPMLIIPMVNDQFDNAKRVDYHKIGYSINFDNFSKELLIEKLIDLLEISLIRENLAKMQSVFHEIDIQKNEVKLVQKLLNEK